MKEGQNYTKYGKYSILISKAPQALIRENTVCDFSGLEV